MNMHGELARLVEQFDGDVLLTFTGSTWSVSDIVFPNQDKGVEFSGVAWESGLITNSEYISTDPDGSALFSIYS